MVLPKRAAVRPRVLTPESGEVLPLEEEIQALAAAGVRGVVYIVGSAGSGKTTALQHLAAVLPPDTPVRLMDDPAALAEKQAPAECLVVRAAASPRAEPNVAVYRLAPWGDDDLIEYLLAVHRERCARVMARLQSADRDLLGGVPELWRIALDELATYPSIPDARSALRGYLRAQLVDADRMKRARRACLRALVTGGSSRPSPPESLARARFPIEVLRVVRHEQVQLLLAAGCIAADLRERADWKYLARQLPRALVQVAAADIAVDSDALRHLRDLIAGPAESHAMGASLLHAADPGWVPELGQVPVLAGAYLDHAAWAGVQLAGADLRWADLSNADLSGANLDGADAYRANLRRVVLARASLRGLRAVRADLAGADLTAARGAETWWTNANLEKANLRDAALAGAQFRGTNLIEARLAGAGLSRAIFAEAEIKDADFSGADLHGACLSRLRLRDAIFSGTRFPGANLSLCDMEGMELPGVDCHGANLERALLTGASLSDGNFREACLRGAGLGEVNMERACLRDADMRGVTFHMGSSRSGLLFTPIASEGTRTGFYTDDADEQNFKSPEEIRKANLCGADLRGAWIDGTDFYLVDLRGALYDAEQEEHFRRCGAILETRAGGTA
jgi:uncharacterized protein YjbI with pentapeptide repeats